MSKEIKRVTKIDNKTFLFETYEKPLREQIQQLKQQLEEKDKEIESYKNKGYIDMLYKEILELKLDNQTQLAIQELEKVKMQLKDKTKMMSNEEHCYQQKVVAWYDICDQINNQIKELKGE